MGFAGHSYYLNVCGKSPMRVSLESTTQHGNSSSTYRFYVRLHNCMSSFRWSDNFFSESILHGRLHMKEKCVSNFLSS